MGSCGIAPGLSEPDVFRSRLSGSHKEMSVGRVEGQLQLIQTETWCTEALFTL